MSPTIVSRERKMKVEKRVGELLTAHKDEGQTTTYILYLISLLHPSNNTSLIHSNNPFTHPSSYSCPTSISSKFLSKIASFRPNRDKMRLLRLLAASLCLPLAQSFSQTPTRIIARSPSPSLRASFEEDPEDAKVVEEVRLNVLNSRRNMIRWTLRNAESVRNLRLKNGWVPKLDESGKPIKSDGKTDRKSTRLNSSHLA